MRRPAIDEHPDVAGDIALTQRIASAYHALVLRASERFGRVRGAVREQPTGSLPALDAIALARVSALWATLPSPFEASLAPATALQNYVYLDWLDRLYRSAGIAAPAAGVLHDVGCASFWYAAALDVFFRPQRLVGIELEGKRRLKGRVNRAERALGYLDGRPHGSFLVADYARHASPADVITAFFPFVTPHPVLAWRLPLSVLAPGALFARIAANLAPGGHFVMANHGPTEAGIASALVRDTGLRALGTLVDEAPLVPRTQTVFLTLWRREA